MEILKKVSDLVPGDKYRFPTGERCYELVAVVKTYEDGNIWLRYKYHNFVYDLDPEKVWQGVYPGWRPVVLIGLV